MWAVPFMGLTSIGAKNIDPTVYLVSVRSDSQKRPFLLSGHPETLKLAGQGLLH